MILIAGLGNIGEEYANTRHNIGFISLDYLLESMAPSGSFQHKFRLNAFVYSITKFDEEDQSLLLIKPDTYMNNSGQAISKVLEYYHIEAQHTIIIHDDLDIRFGELKVGMAKGPREHNGINSIEKYVGKAFWRIRIGVENRAEELRQQISGKDYVLDKFNQSEKEILLAKVLPEFKRRLAETISQINEHPTLV